MTYDAHRHLGVLPAYPFYGGPPVKPDVTARATIAALIADLNREGTSRALILPNYGVPDPDVAFGFNDLVVEATQRDDRLRCGLWVSALESDRARTAQALRLAGEPGVRALKISFLLGGSIDDPGLAPIFDAARAHNLVVHVHTSPGAASDIDKVGQLVDRHGDDVRIHLVHFGGGMSGHIKLIGGRFFDWIAAGKQVYTDLSWAIGFAPRWLADEIDRRGIGHDRVLFASDEPWGDHAGELARLQAAAAGRELGEAVFHGNFSKLYD
ncbi:amidohydrolase family protein [Paractinoplanes lichenicola]|uniref:Amidohydrolase family protein n=1 Tax=Paractinoplanes lichenicola TaxID=2802976 RepID=A0ABS1VU14_9ACTN|nr:amidohydrolase family protein [Actinoplanes lichenicola]MBL7257969.1 amidohydrolase family protein [Actinoplanes lichenicola]